MASRSKVPSADEHARLWAKLPTTDRRRIFRAVVRGQTLTNRKDARLAVGTARQQVRYWRRVWPAGALMGAISIPDWGAVAITGGMGLVIMGAISAFRLRRAAAAERGNLERIGAA